MNNKMNNIISARVRMIMLAQEKIGKLYAWAGDGPDFYDCSGLIINIMQKIQFDYSLWPDFLVNDLTANGLYNNLDELGYPDITSTYNLLPGTIVFYRNSRNYIVHAVIHCCNIPDQGPLAIDAGGGSSSTITPRDCLLRAASVRFVATDRGKNWVGKDPFR